MEESKLPQQKESQANNASAQPAKSTKRPEMPPRENPRKVYSKQRLLDSFVHSTKIDFSVFESSSLAEHMEFFHSTNV